MGLPIPMSRKHTYAYNVYTNCKHILNAINLILGRIEWLQFHLHVSILSALLPFTFIYSKYESIGYKTCYAWQFLMIDVGYFHSLPFHFDHMRREFPTNICVCDAIQFPLPHLFNIWNLDFLFFVYIYGKLFIHSTQVVGWIFIFLTKLARARVKWNRIIAQRKQ